MLAAFQQVTLKYCRANQNTSSTITSLLARVLQASAILIDFFRCQRCGTEPFDFS